MPKRLLIVDDEDTVRKNLCIALKIKGYETEGAASGEEALRLLDEFKPELMLLDLHLEGDVPGIDVLKKVKETGSDVKVLVLTGFGKDDDIVNECLGLGAVKFLEKPLGPDQIKKELEEIS